MKNYIQFSVYALALMLLSCQSQEKELSYQDLFRLVLEDTGEPLEWHGEALDTSAEKFLKLSKSGTCGEGDCGEACFLENTSDQSVEAMIQASFVLGGTESYLAAKYILNPGEKVSLGCSHLCNEGESIPFERRIVGAKVVK